MTSFWSGYIILLVLSNILGCVFLLIVTRKNNTGVSEGEELKHSFDGIKELNNPLPKWWLWLFVITILFSGIYLYLYPGLGSYKGYLNWTSVSQWRSEVRQADKRYGPTFQKYGQMPIEKLIKKPKALEIGQRLFSNNCAMCHGSDARGAKGFPDLTDDDWLYGGSPQEIETTILHGRQGVMPPLAPAIGGENGVEAVAHYILSLNNRKHDEIKARDGKQKYMMVCIACHGPTGTGNKLIGAPNLTNNIWLYGGSKKAIKDAVMFGRSGKMPAHEQLLGKDKVHILAAYVYSLSHNKRKISEQ
jgi:cytochrome c oxidase cbb3-type subunit 3